MKWQETGWQTVAAEGPPASARSCTLSSNWFYEKNRARDFESLAKPRLAELWWQRK